MAFGKKNEVKVDPLSYSICLLGESKVGKEQPVSEPVLTECGWVPMGEIKVGDKVYGEDGELHNVVGVYPQGVKDVYEVSFRDGTKTRCGLDHLWTVSSKKQRANMRIYKDKRDMTLCLKDIIKDYKSWVVEGEDECRPNGGHFSYKYSVPINNAIKFADNSDELCIDPYALGLILGDGGLTGTAITFTNSEKGLFEQLEDGLSNFNTELHIRDFENHQQATLCSKEHCNPLRLELKELGLLGCGSREKFIPKKYMYTSVENRCALLSGIINTDGSISGRNNTSITIDTYSESLACDIAEVARSIGLIATVCCHDRTDETSTKKYENEIEYVVRIISDDYSMFNLSSKHKTRLNGKSISYAKSLSNIELVGQEECQCIMTDNPSHLYITNDYIVTHNTTLIKDVCEKLLSDDKGNLPDNSYMFMELGSERGCDAIQGANHINCPEWNMDYDEITNSAGFADVCMDIIENKHEEYPNLRVVIWDTYDHLIELAQDESLRLFNKECRSSGHPEKCTKSHNAAWGGFGKSDQKAMKLMFDMKAELKKVGVETIVIGHTKKKDLTDAITNETYQTITSDQQQNYFSRLKKELHFLGLAYVDRQIVKQKTGKKNIVNGKEEIVNRVESECRKIRFRDDNHTVDSGSRFAEIAEVIDLDADQFIQALTNAIKAEQSKSGVSFDETKKKQEKQAAEAEKRVAKQEEEHKAKKELDTVVNDIVGFFTDNKSDVSKIKPILAAVKEKGYASPKDISSIEDAKAILAMTLSA